MVNLLNKESQFSPFDERFLQIPCLGLIEKNVPILGKFIYILII